MNDAHIPTTDLDRGVASVAGLAGIDTKVDIADGISARVAYQSGTGPGGAATIIVTVKAIVALAGTVTIAGELAGMALLLEEGLTGSEAAESRK